MPKNVPGRALCSVDWCNAFAHGAGFCMTHYRQIRVSGTIAPWTQVGDQRVRPCDACGTNVSSLSGRTRFCLDCKRRKARLKAAAQFAADPEKVRRRGRESERRQRQDPARRAKKQSVQKSARLWRDYRLTTEEYDRLVARSGGHCGICARPAKLHIDHDHATGAVRGLLCGPCNTMLGMAKDGPGLLRAGAHYIECGGVVNVEPYDEEQRAARERTRRELREAFV